MNEDLSANKLPTIDIGELSKGCPALTPAKGTALAEAAAVCLEHNAHTLEVKMAITGTYVEGVSLRRFDVTEQMRLGNADMQDATEDGATGVAILAARRHTGLTVVERNAKIGGFDWYLGNEPKDEFSLMENVARLEVSGILKGDNSAIASRVKQKLAQISPSDGTGLPGFAAVVEFSRPETRVIRK